MLLSPLCSLLFISFLFVFIILERKCHILEFFVLQNFVEKSCFVCFFFVIQKTTTLSFSFSFSGFSFPPQKKRVFFGLKFSNKKFWKEDDIEGRLSLPYVKPFSLCLTSSISSLKKKFIYTLFKLPLYVNILLLFFVFIIKNKFMTATCGHYGFPCHWYYLQLRKQWILVIRNGLTATNCPQLVEDQTGNKAIKKYFAICP